MAISRRIANSISFGVMAPKKEQHAPAISLNKRLLTAKWFLNLQVPHPDYFSSLRHHRI